MSWPFLHKEKVDAMPYREFTGWLRKQRRRQSWLRLIYLLFYPLNRYLDFYLLNYPRIFGDRRRLHIGPDVILNNAIINTVSGHVTIKANAFLGHNVALLTGSHSFLCTGLERQYKVPQNGRDILIETGVWIGSGVLVVGPCHIGAHAVVGAGSVVTHDIPPQTLSAGNPARVVKTLAL